jgi:hypothetical protein
VTATAPASIHTERRSRANAPNPVEQQDHGDLHAGGVGDVATHTEQHPHRHHHENDRDDRQRPAPPNRHAACEQCRHERDVQVVRDRMSQPHLQLDLHPHGDPGELVEPHEIQPTKAT